MIFVTVGSDVPFDRLVSAVDEWAGLTGRRDVFAQIGRSSLRPSHIEHTAFIDPRVFVDRMKQASVVVSHAGMGTILTALYYQKPLLVMPRRASLGETRSDHQFATARHLAEIAKIAVAPDEVALIDKLQTIDGLRAQHLISSHAQPELIAALKQFIHQSR